MIPLVIGAAAAAVAAGAYFYQKKTDANAKDDDPTTPNIDPQRLAQARANLTPNVMQKLQQLDQELDGTVFLAPKDIDGIDGTKKETNVKKETDEPSYFSQRARPFYLNSAHYPSAIVWVKTVQDVQKAIKVIAEIVPHQTTADGSDPASMNNPLQLCVAAGCHSAYCMVQGSIVIDLQELKGGSVNVQDKTLTIQGGAQIKDAHALLQASATDTLALAFATGTNQTTGVSGLTLQGGAGYLGGQAGYACDTVLQAKVVLPSGALVTATDTNQHANLLKALRGGGGNFGIVVEWTFQLFDVTKAMGGMVVHMAPTVAAATTTVQNYATALQDIPDPAGALCALPCGAPVVANVLTLLGETVPNSYKYKDVPFFQTISTLKGPWLRVQNDLNGRKDYFANIAPLLEPLQQPCHACTLGCMVYDLNAAAKTLVHFARVDYPNTKSTIIIQSLTGQMRHNKAAQISSLTHRHAEAWIVIEATWDATATTEDIDQVLAWGQRLKQELIQLGVGQDGPHEFVDSNGQRTLYSNHEQREFLQAAKQQYDPSNLLRLNKNILVQEVEVK